MSSGHIVPAVNAVDVKVDISKDDLDIDIWGSVWTDFASVFEVFFKGTVVDIIDNAITGVLNDTVPDGLNSVVANLGGNTLVPGFSSWYLDW